MFSLHSLSYAGGDFKCKRALDSGSQCSAALILAYSVVLFGWPAEPVVTCRLNGTLYFIVGKLFLSIDA